MTGVTAWSTELEVAQALCRGAGRVLLDYRGRALAVEQKDGGEPVTAADRECSELIVRGLARAFPGDFIVSEEADVDFERLAHARRVWFVDPLDGTREFVRGMPSFSVLIGLAIDAHPVLGVVHRPVDERTYCVAPDVPPCVIDAAGEPRGLQVAVRTSLAQARLLVSQTDRRASLDAAKRALGIADEQPMGSVGLKLCAIAAGDYDVYINPTPGAKAWDTCAAQAILLAAGGSITSLAGLPLRYDGHGHDLHHRQGVLATGGRHAEILARLRDVLQVPPASA